MNLIQNQAETFYEYNFSDRDDHKDFVQGLRIELDEYRKNSHKLEFIDVILKRLKLGYDKHLESCEYKNDRLKCSINSNYENTLFFVQNEKEGIIEKLDSTEFTILERKLTNESLTKIIEDLSEIKLGQELTYTDLYDEFQELKEYYFLNKKHWSQLFIGRISEMVAGGVISETVSKEIVTTVMKNYQGLIS
ncbi:hypothetical protein [Olleya sp. HaHaR_3_96]|uniref:hypothetical protein n=1 Tax=Olleya sp. HaHaR_3_96 TaxID=2745560 RepID=UPI001C4E9CB8|nr:hypothetical protein [Olleya sp. HaHaR_3_96]QXP60267.1 hypothetical protein H0I26_01085 [Olleya sp. HaHaR_3_96]